MLTVLHSLAPDHGEFFNAVHEHLSSGGVMIINVGRTDTSRQLIDELASTILAIFPSVHVVDLPYSYNSRRCCNRPADGFRQLLEASLNSSFLEPHILCWKPCRSPLPTCGRLPQSTIVYTDDLAPVELVTNQLVLSYLFFPHTDPIP